MGNVGTGTGMSAMGQMISLDTVKTGNSIYSKVEISNTRYVGGHVKKEIRNKVPS